MIDFLKGFSLNAIFVIDTLDTGLEVADFGATVEKGSVFVSKGKGTSFGPLSLEDFIL